MTYFIYNLYYKDFFSLKKKKKEQQKKIKLFPNLTK